MKKIMSIALTGLLAATLAHAAENEVYSVNVVGFQKSTISGPNKLAMVACPFESGEMTLLDIFGTNTLQQGTTPGECDRIRLWDATAQQYISVAQYVDGLFYLLTQSGAWDPGYIVTNPVVCAGDGFWITTATGEQEPRLFTFVGDVIMDRTNEVSIVAGFQIVSYPFSTELQMSNATFSACGATGSDTPGTADRIRVWNRETQSYDGYALYVDDLWYKLTSSGAWDPSYQTIDMVLQPGDAFWYYAQSPFVWTEESPYWSSIND